MASLQEKFKKVDEVAKKAAEEKNNFINTTKETLEQKMKAHIDNRENIITDMKVKLNQHVCIKYIANLMRDQNRAGIMSDFTKSNCIFL